MKNIILLFGFIASASLTGISVLEQTVPSSKADFDRSSSELQIALNYTGTNEDGETETVDTSNGR